MSKALITLKKISGEAQAHINAIYGSIDKFYATVYLIAKNEHLLQQEKPAAWEQKIRTVHAYQGIIRFMLDELEIDGKELMADITSDYLEDYVSFREKNFNMTDEEFIRILKRIA